MTSLNENLKKNVSVKTALAESTLVETMLVETIFLETMLKTFVFKGSPLTYADSAHF